MGLNDRQKKLLKLLSINSRFSNKDIAKSLHCSEDAVEYQIKNLIEKEKLASFSIQFDYGLIGYNQYHLLIKVKNLDIDYVSLNKITELISINSSYGKYDLQIIAITKNKIELEKTIEKIKEVIDIQDITVAEFSSYIKRFTNVIPPINIQTNIPKNKKNPAYELNTEQYAFSEDRSQIKLDKTDKKIISLLLKNPRMKFSEIAEKANLNHETIRYRIRGYIKRKFIMNFGLLHNFEKNELYTTQLLVTLKNVSPSLENFLNKDQNIFYSAKLMGAYNAVIYVLSKNPLELAEKLREIRKAMGEDLINLDLLQLEKIHKYLQFPLKEIE